MTASQSTRETEGYEIVRLVGVAVGHAIATRLPAEPRNNKVLPRPVYRWRGDTEEEIAAYEAVATGVSRSRDHWRCPHIDFRPRAFLRSSHSPFVTEAGRLLFGNGRAVPWSAGSRPLQLTYIGPLLTNVKVATEWTIFLRLGDRDRVMRTFIQACLGEIVRAEVLPPSALEEIGAQIKAALLASAANDPDRKLRGRITQGTLEIFNAIDQVLAPHRQQSKQDLPSVGSEDRDTRAGSNIPPDATQGVSSGPLGNVESTVHSNTRHRGASSGSGAPPGGTPPPGSSSGGPDPSDWNTRKQAMLAIAAGHIEHLENISTQAKGLRQRHPSGRRRDFSLTEGTALRQLRGLNIAAGNVITFLTSYNGALKEASEPNDPYLIMTARATASSIVESVADLEPLTPNAPGAKWEVKSTLEINRERALEPAFKGQALYVWPNTAAGAAALYLEEALATIRRSMHPELNPPTRGNEGNTMPDSPGR